jgi:MYXO-CTERM domain-containing protein
VAAVPTAAHASEGFEPWTGGAVGVVLLLLVTGAFTYRRRRRTRPS